ncbi:MAG: hypothetical protein K8S16_09305 [Bacteroidales bacterium]|nr:hypothetical protein [Bacteroidales bacterium]
MIGLNLNNLILILVNFLNKLINSVIITLLSVLKPDNDIRSFLYTLWQVQASIAILSIAIIMIMLTAYKIRIYGQKLISTINNRGIFSFSKLSIVCFILIGVMTLPVILEKILLTIILFFITLIIVIYLFTDSLKIILSPQKYREKIKIQIIKIMKSDCNDKLKNEYITQIRAHTLDLITQDNDTEATENVKLIFNLISIVNNIKITDQLHSSMIDIINKFQRVRRFEQANEVIVQYYYIIEKLDNKQKKRKYQNNIFRIVGYRILALNSINNSQEIYENSALELLVLFLDNLNISKDLHIMKYLQRAFPKLFINVINNKLTENEIEDVLKIYYNKLFNSVYEKCKTQGKIDYFIYIVVNISDSFFRKYVETKGNIYWDNYLKIYNDFYDYPTMIEHKHKIVIIYLLRIWCLNDTWNSSITNHKNIEFLNKVKGNFKSWLAQIKSIENLWDYYDFSVTIMNSLEHNYRNLSKGIKYGTFYLKTLDFFIFASTIKTYTNGESTINLPREDYDRLYLYFDGNGDFGIDSNGTKEYITKFYKFIRFSELDEAEFIRRANEFYEHVKMKNEHLPS